MIASATVVTSGEGEPGRRTNTKRRVSRFTADRDGSYPIGELWHEGRSDRGHREAGFHEAELSEPVTHDVSNVGAFGQARPDAHQRVAAFAGTADPDQPGQFLGFDRSSSRQGMVAPDGHHEIAFGERRHVERR